MKSKNSGFTLVELMISILLSSLLIAAIAIVFLQSNKSFKKQQSLSYMVEDGRYAIELFAKEMRRVGFLINRNIVLNDADSIFPADLDSIDSGVDFAIGEHINGAVNDTAGFNSTHDINHVVFRYQLQPGGSCNDTDYNTKADCENNGASWTSDTNDQDSGLTACSSQVSDTGVNTAEIKTIYFFVADSAGTPTLFCSAKSSLKDGTVINSSSDLALVSNVEKVFVLYGEDTNGDGDANKYLPANLITTWKSVVSIRIYLVLMSENTNITNSTPSYQIDDTVYSVTVPNDKRLYRVFSTTVAFRN